MDNSHHKHQLVSATKRFILESTIALKSKAHTEAVFQCACHLQDSCSPVVQAHSPDWNRAIFFPQQHAKGSVLRREESIPASTPHSPARLLGNFVMAKVSNRAVVTGLLLPHIQPKSQTTAHIVWKSSLALTPFKLHQDLYPPWRKSRCVMRQIMSTAHQYLTSR